MDKQAILQEIKQCYNLTELQPDDITLDDVSETLGVCKETARTYMKKLVFEKKFIEIKVKIDGHRANVYRKEKTA